MVFHAQIVQFPTPSPLGLAILLLVFLGLLGGAIAFELHRRRELDRVVHANRSAAFDKVLADRGLNAAEMETLRGLVHQFARTEPVEAITTRLAFGRMIDAAMQHYARNHAEAAYRNYGLHLRDIRVQLGLDLTPLGQQILSTRELDGGQQLDMALESSEDWLPMQVDDVDEAYFYLRYRGDGPAPTLPAASQRVKCHLWRDEDGRYAFSTTVVVSELAPLRLTLAHTTELKRTQNREFFRVRHDQTAMIGLLSAKLSDTTRDLRLEQPVTRLRGRVTSLSAGGAAIVLQQPITKQMLLRIALDLPDERPLEVHAKIVSTLPISGGRYLLRTEFVNAAEEDLDVISRHVMRKQQQTLSAHHTKDTH